VDLTYVDEKKLKTLEDYAVFIGTAMLTLTTLQNYEIRAIEIGILPEDMNTRSNTLIWDIRRLITMYKVQLEHVLDLVPDDFNASAIIEKLKKTELTKARSMIRKERKKCDTSSTPESLPTSKQ
jgi:hypothetical protein